MSEFYWTGVGRRKAPEPVLSLARQLGVMATDNGGHLRTGEAIGMDTAFRRGVDHVNPNQKSVFTVKDEAWCAQYVRHFSSPTFDSWEDALAIAKSIHPNWSACNPYVRALHARNAYQVLGPDLDDPSAFLVCWSQPLSNGGVKGGTNTAVMIARDWEIPVFNLFEEGTFDRLSWLILQERFTSE